MLKKIFLEDIHYKATALVIGFFLWFAVNFGAKSVVSIEKELEIKNTEDRYVYKLARKKVRLKVAFIERFVPMEMVERVQPFVDVRGLPAGRHILKVLVSNPYRVFISVEKLEPERVEVYVLEAPHKGE